MSLKPRLHETTEGGEEAPFSLFLATTACARNNPKIVLKEALYVRGLTNKLHSLVRLG